MRALVLLLSALYLPLPAGAKEKVFRDELWGIELRLEKGRVWRDHPLEDQANFILALQSKQQGCELNLSLFAIAHPEESGPSACREGFVGNPQVLGGQPAVTIHEQAAAPVAYTLFERSASVLTQNELYGYWTRRDTCFELHVSSVDCTGFRDLAMGILQSVRLGDDTGVSLETVAVAAGAGIDPRDWRVHLRVASVYLHEVSPPVPERARRFYRSALEAAGDDLDPLSEWAIQAGIGLAWLMEDDGGRAIPALERALEVAAPRSEASLETLYNLACAYSLAGRIGDACGALETLHEAAEGEDPEARWREIEADPQLAGARGSECYALLRSRD